MEVTPVHMIAAVEKNGGIGLNGALPWRIEEDWRYFLNHVTRDGSEICEEKKERLVWIFGRKTWETTFKLGGLLREQIKSSLFCIILSKSESSIKENQNQSRIDQLNPDRSEQSIDQLDCLEAKGLDKDESFLPEHKFATNWNEVLEIISGLGRVYAAWNLGGPGVYAAQLTSGHLRNTRLYLTRIDREYNCDSWFPNLDPFSVDILQTRNQLELQEVQFTLVKNRTSATEQAKDGINLSYQIYEFKQK